METKTQSSLRHIANLLRYERESGQILAAEETIDLLTDLADMLEEGFEPAAADTLSRAAEKAMERLLTERRQKLAGLRAKAEQAWSALFPGRVPCPYCGSNALLPDTLRPGVLICNECKGDARFESD